ncbi:MAG: mRNA surveillance protein pelota [Candidatus Woesearchaeota archaeon]
MIQVHADLRKGLVKLQVENNDDLWVLSQLIEPNDLVSAKTVRKLKVGSVDDRQTSAVKRVVFVTISVEKVELNSSLRLSGKIVEAPEDIPKGVYHTLDLEEHSRLTVVKEHWLSYQLDKLKDSYRSKPTNVLVLLLDREEAFFAALKTHGYEILSHLLGDVQKKDSPDKVHKVFFSELVKMLVDYDSRFGFTRIIVASPSFWKEDLQKLIVDKALRSKLILATTSSVTESGLSELLRRPEVQSALVSERIAQESAMVEELFLEISRSGSASYGFDQVLACAQAGAVKTLLVSDSFIKAMRESGSFSRLEQLMKLVEDLRGVVRIISVEHDAGKRFQGLCGIAAILRYKLST